MTIRRMRSAPAPVENAIAGKRPDKWYPIPEVTIGNRRTRIPCLPPLLPR
jgi:hypothetical protein